MSVESFGQFAMLPINLGLMIGFEWQGALVVLSLLAFLILPFGFGILSSPTLETSVEEDVRFLQALKDAFATRDFWLLSLGFFACGIQVLFIAVHLPAFLAGEGLVSGVATIVLALIGLVNIAGTNGLILIVHHFTNDWYRCSYMGRQTYVDARRNCIFAHQLGTFSGGWLYVKTGSYDMAWALQ